MFVYSGYWRTWSRVLGCRPGWDGWLVEVNLTPINAQFGQAEWDTQVLPVVVRCHCTPRSDDDRVLEELPTSVLADMSAHLPSLTVDILLTADLLPVIDWVKYDAICNGGAKLSDVRKL